MNSRTIVVVALMVVIAAATLTSAAVDVLNRRDAQRAADALQSQ
jgi:hypothetical protein